VGVRKPHAGHDFSNDFTFLLMPSLITQAAANLFAVKHSNPLEIAAEQIF
jgi:hypothetical protein